jgi:hypothetical protein
MTRVLRQAMRPFVWISGLVGIRAATATEYARRKPIELPIVSDGENVVNLIEIVPSNLILFKPEDYDHVWCLVIDESSFTLDHATKWIVEARQLNMSPPAKRYLPTITLLVNMEKLSKEDLTLISTELIPIGVLLVRWPEGADTAEAALKVLRDEMKDSYGEPNFNKQIKWGHTLVQAEGPSALQAV